MNVVNERFAKSVIKQINKAQKEFTGRCEGSRPEIQENEQKKAKLAFGYGDDAIVHVTNGAFAAALSELQKAHQCLDNSGAHGAYQWVVAHDICERVVRAIDKIAGVPEQLVLLVEDNWSRGEEGFRFASEVVGFDLITSSNVEQYANIGAGDYPGRNEPNFSGAVGDYHISEMASRPSYLKGPPSRALCRLDETGNWAMVCHFHMRDEEVDDDVPNFYECDDYDPDFSLLMRSIEDVDYNVDARSAAWNERIAQMTEAEATALYRCTLEEPDMATDIADVKDLLTKEHPDNLDASLDVLHSIAPGTYDNIILGARNMSDEVGAPPTRQEVIQQHLATLGLRMEHSLSVLDGEGHAIMRIDTDELADYEDLPPGVIALAEEWTVLEGQHTRPAQAPSFESDVDDDCSDSMSM